MPQRIWTLFSVSIIIVLLCFDYVNFFWIVAIPSPELPFFVCVKYHIQAPFQTSVCLCGKNKIQLMLYVILFLWWAGKDSNLRTQMRTDFLLL